MYPIIRRPSTAEKVKRTFLNLLPFPHKSLDLSTLIRSPPPHPPLSCPYNQETSQMLPATPKLKQRRGFAIMDPERQREIARKGGAAVPSDRRSFSQNHELAVLAGAKGGTNSHGGGRKKIT